MVGGGGGGRGQEKGSLADKMTRQKEQEDQAEKKSNWKEESSNSPEIPGAETSDIPCLPSGYLSRYALFTDH